MITRRRYRLTLVLPAVWLALLAAPATAAPLSVVVRDVSGVPVPDVAVYVAWPGSDTRAVARPTAVMDQRDTRFVPHILVVQKGTAVEFPNSDVVAHHVYSFSKPNNFVLPLYKGDPHDPVTFWHDGIVTLGCNIHDQMLGYIVVVGTDVFGMTNAEGRVALDLPDPAADAHITIWSPRIRDDASRLTKSLPAAAGEISFTLAERLRPPHDAGTEAVRWDDY